MDESDVLRIKVAAYAEPLVADRGILSCWSSCVRGLPLDAAEWDLSNLAIEGQAVERSTVVAWLNLIYKMVTAKDFERQEPNTAHTLRGMGQLLAFADAVGSSRGILLALDSQDAEVFRADVQLGEAPIALMFTSDLYYCFQTNSTSTVRLVRFKTSTLDLVGSANQVSLGTGSSTMMAECRRQLAHDMEVLLFQAFKQRLPRLANIARSFLNRDNRGTKEPLFPREAQDAVFSDRVLEAVILHSCCPSLRLAVIGSILRTQVAWPDKD